MEKKKIDLIDLFAYIIGGCALIGFFMAFLPGLVYKGESLSTMELIFGSSRFNGVPWFAEEQYWDNATLSFNSVLFMVFIASLAAGVLAALSKKHRIIMLSVATICFIMSAVFMFYVRTYTGYQIISLEGSNPTTRLFDAATLGAGIIVPAVISILCACGCIAILCYEIIVKKAFNKIFGPVEKEDKLL